MIRDPFKELRTRDKFKIRFKGLRRSLRNLKLKLFIFIVSLSSGQYTVDMKSRGLRKHGRGEGMTHRASGRYLLCFNMKTIANNIPNYAHIYVTVKAHLEGMWWR